MPTALTQPLQLGSQATQLKRIGSLRSSSVTLAFAVLTGVVTEPGNAKHRTAAPISAQPRSSNDFTDLNLVPSPSPKRASKSSPKTRHDSVMQALSKR